MLWLLINQSVLTALVFSGAVMYLRRFIMKRITVTFLVCAFIMSLCSCGKEDDSFSRPDEITLSSQEDDIQLTELKPGKQTPEAYQNGGGSMGTYPDPMKMTYEYNGGQMEITFNIGLDNAGKEIGLVLYLDGIPQPFTVEGQSKETYMYTYTATKENESVLLKVKFKPVTGKKGDTLNLYYNVQSAPSSRARKGYLDDMSYISNFGADVKKIKFNADGGSTNADACKDYSTSTIPKIYRESIIQYNANHEIEYDPFNLVVVYNIKCGNIGTNGDINKAANSEALKYIDLTKGKSTYSLELFSGKKKPYRIIAYINNEIVPVFDGKDYMDVQFKDDELITKEFILDPDKLTLTGSDIFYIKFIPLDPEVDVNKSEPLYETRTLIVES